jgi:uncharacterized protein YggE
MMNRIRWTAALLGLAGLLALPAAAATSSPADASSPATITVTGTGTVKGVPGLSSWSFGATTRADTASAAFAAANAAMRKLIAALKAEGIAAEDIQTQQVSLMVQQSPDGTKATGFQASGSVQVTVRALDKAGAVVDAAVAAGATDIGGPSFSVAGQDELYRRALAAAVDDATAKAKALAAKAGVTLGRLTSLTEQTGGMPIPYRADASKASGGGASVPIEPGQTEVSASVTAVFAIG